MQPETHKAEAGIEETHWWFVVRRRLFLREILKAGIAHDAKILDVGTSTGTNLRMLRDGGFTDVTALDFSPLAAELCREKGLGEVRIGDACAMPFPGYTFDLVIASDIIEHIEDDALAVSEIYRVLKPGGTVLFTVPAFPQLWGLQDEVSHHKRRYYRRDFLQLVRNAGFDVSTEYYFNYLLFVPIWAVRQLLRTRKEKPASENHINNAWINRVLTIVFDLDTKTAPVLRPPFGVSYLCRVHKGGAV